MSLTETNQNDHEINISTKESPDIDLNQDFESMPIKQLNEIEDKIKNEFKNLSKKYIKNRISRINSIIDKLKNSIKITQDNDKSWLKIYNFEIETINNILTNTEDLIMIKNGTLKNKPDLLNLEEYEEELKEIFQNLQSPFDFDNTFKYDNNEIYQKLNNNNNNENENENLSKIPFPFAFNECFKPYRDELRSINFSKDYESQLIKNSYKSNSVIIWKQYYTNLINSKTDLMNQTNHKLTELYKDHHLLNSTKNQVAYNDYYYRTLNSIDCFKNDKDSKYSSSNKNKSNQTPKNKIELSMIRQDILKNNTLIDIQKSIKRTYHDAFNTEEISPENDELDNDLNLIRSSIAQKRSHYYNNGINLDDEFDEDGNYQNEVLHLNDFTSESSSSSPITSGEEFELISDDEEDIETQNYRYLPKSLHEILYEEYDVEEDMNEEELKERTLYKAVLQQNNDQIDEKNKFIMQNIPPLDKFLSL
ncbi:uncharacterized protein KGF55_004487 [Candida pseudojiufengensis]|uniref:uncharacterized protein n=1 Tax=Candida pseudojiufengensis TaxID=497109 RepID=UPI002224BA29|nr:uncharacterized protein KGF55_004487 [Candida pseudojiufengensis]KAI5960594.1 hypothetical protein KGF55_004487 [Candida pseudojiufengensis]